jgi:hypothetical protein
MSTREEHKAVLKSGSIYGYEYAIAGTYGLVTDIEGNTDKVPLLVQIEEDVSGEFGTVLPEVQGREVRIEYIPDIQYNTTEAPLSRICFTTVTTYTEVQYYSKEETLKSSVLGKNHRISGKSPTISGTTNNTYTTASATATSRANPTFTSGTKEEHHVPGTKSTSVVEKIIDFVRYTTVQVKCYSTGSTETKIYSTRKPRGLYSVAVDTYIGTQLDILTVKLDGTSTSTTRFIFPATVLHRYLYGTGAERLGRRSVR